MQTSGLNLTKITTFSPKVCIFCNRHLKNDKWIYTLIKLHLKKLHDCFLMVYYRILKSTYTHHQLPIF